MMLAIIAVQEIFQKNEYKVQNKKKTNKITWDKER